MEFISLSTHVSTDGESFRVGFQWDPAVSISASPSLVLSSVSCFPSDGKNNDQQVSGAEQDKGLFFPLTS